MLGRVANAVIKLGKNVPKATIHTSNIRLKNSENDQQSDVVIIGGGAMGSSTAYWLTERNPNLKVTVIEKDPTYSRCSTVLSVGGIRQQFSLAENIEMSLFGADFFKHLKGRFGPEADVLFVPNGYLILSTQEGAQQLIANHNLQIQMGAVNKLLNKEKLLAHFPWMNVDDLELGCLGIEKEGWFDPWALLTLFRTAAIRNNANFIRGEVLDFTNSAGEELREVVIKLPDGSHRTHKFSQCVLAAGAESGQLAKLVNIDLPVERRKRFVYRYGCQGQNAPGPKTPLLIDYNGMYFRRDGLGDCFIGGMSPDLEDEPEPNNLDEIDYDFFNDKVWPLMAKRVSAFECIKVQSAWAGFYEYNTFDENGIIGQHSIYKNLYFATGFSGHGIQQSPAVGKAISELILDGGFKTIDLKNLGYGRLIENKPMYEVGIY